MNKIMRSGVVGIIGKPNVGKSTLLNEMLGKKVSITSSKAQTTQKNIIAIDNTDDYQMVFVDTPGIHDRTSHKYYRHLNALARNTAQEVDVLLYLCDDRGWNEQDELIWSLLAIQDIPHIICINKVDKIKNKSQLFKQLSILKERSQSENLLPISAFRRVNLSVLKNLLLEQLPEQPKLYNSSALVSQENDHILEIIREKIFRLTGQEIPYEMVLSMRQQTDSAAIRHIFVDIMVKKSGQKAILLGKYGHKMRDIGTLARLDIEKLIQKKVCLKLWVKVCEISQIEAEAQTHGSYLMQPIAQSPR